MLESMSLLDVSLGRRDSLSNWLKTSVLIGNWLLVTASIISAVETIPHIKSKHDRYQKMNALEWMNKRLTKENLGVENHSAQVKHLTYKIFLKPEWSFYFLVSWYLNRLREYKNKRFLNLLSSEHKTRVVNKSLKDNQKRLNYSSRMQNRHWSVVLSDFKKKRRM